jgi:hypothetical protein
MTRQAISGSNDTTTRRTAVDAEFSQGNGAGCDEPNKSISYDLVPVAKQHRGSTTPARRSFTEPSGTIEELLGALLAAPAEVRIAALRLLRGDIETADSAAGSRRPEPYLTLAGLAAAAGVSTSTLRRWRVPSHELGGRPRYRFSEVQDYLATDQFKRRVAALRAERRAARQMPQKEGYRQPRVLDGRADSEDVVSEKQIRQQHTERRLP